MSLPLSLLLLTLLLHLSLLLHASHTAAAIVGTAAFLLLFLKGCRSSFNLDEKGMIGKSKYRRRTVDGFQIFFFFLCFLS
jgi:hypothetical protein